MSYMKIGEDMNYIIHGEEAYLLKKNKKEIIAQWISDENEMSVVEYDAANKDFSIAHVVEDAQTIPFFTEYKVIVINNPTFLSATGSINEKDNNLLSSYLNDSNSSTIIIFYLENIKLDSRKKIVKTLKKSARDIKCDKLDASQFNAYLNDKIKTMEIKIDKNAYQELLSRLNNDLTILNNELNKLQLYEKHITLKDVEDLVSRPLEDKAYELVNAIVGKNLKKTFKIYQDLCVNKVNQIMLITIIGRQFRMMYTVKQLTLDGNSEQSIATKIKVHPYPVKLAKQASMYIEFDDLLALLNECAKLDQKIKNGTIDKDLGFELFLIKICQRSF